MESTVNVMGRAPVTNAEFTKAFAAALRRLAILRPTGETPVQRSTATNTELIVVDPRHNIRRVMATLPQSVTVLAPGATA